MATSDAATPEEYLASLPPGRREAIAAVRDVILRNLPPGFEEGMQFGMIGYYVPLDRFPDTYHGLPLGLAALANQKNHMALYLNNVYGDPETERRFRERYAASGKHLDMGKSCVRFTRLDALPLDVIGHDRGDGRGLVPRALSGSPWLVTEGPHRCVLALSRSGYVAAVP